MSNEIKFLEALDKGDVINFNALIEMVDISKCVDVDGQTAVHLAAIYGNLYFLQELVNRGADVTLVDNAGYTPLQAMVMHVLDEGVLFNERRTNTMEALLRNGATVAEIEALRNGDRDEFLEGIIDAANATKTDLAIDEAEEAHIEVLDNGGAGGGYYGGPDVPAPAASPDFVLGVVVAPGSGLL